MIDNERLQARFSDEESHARQVAWKTVNDTLMNHSTEALIENVVNHFAVEPVQVDFDHVWKTTEVGPSYESESSFYVQTTLHANCNESAQYIGDRSKTLVRGVTNDRSMKWEICRIFIAPSVTDDPQLIAGYKAEFENDIRADSLLCNAEISAHRERLLDQVREIFTIRAEQLKSSNEAAQAINIHLTPAPDPIIIPLVPKSLSLSTAKKRQVAGTPVAGLANEIADELVRTLRSFALALERQPVLAGSMVTKNEEALRDILLFILNSQWEGAVTGESFVGRGKTDVLFRWENADAFIGECKMWKGPQAFTAGIDQLLGYTVWRDTRAGLILFIKNKKDVTAAIESAVKCITDHPNFIEAGAGEHEFVIHSEHDDRRRIRLSLIPVHIQTYDSEDPVNPVQTASKSDNC